MVINIYTALPTVLYMAEKRKSAKYMKNRLKKKKAIKKGKKMKCHLGNNSWLVLNLSALNMIQINNVRDSPI